MANEQQSRSERCQHQKLSWDLLFCKAICPDCGTRFVERALMDETVSERPLLPDVVVEALKGACYVPGHYKEIAHRMYCRWCSYAMGHPHGDKCVMNLVEQQGERPDLEGGKK